MKVVVQRVSQARVLVNDLVTGEIGSGMLLLVGFGPNDTPEKIVQMAKKIVKLRIFSDEQGKMNLDSYSNHSQILVVSQFTLYADTSGRRPGFSQAASPELAQKLYALFIEQLKQREISVQSGRFGAEMQVELINDGPVTLLLEK